MPVEVSGSPSVSGREQWIHFQRTDRPLLEEVLKTWFDWIHHDLKRVESELTRSQSNPSWWKSLISCLALLVCTSYISARKVNDGSSIWGKGHIRAQYIVRPYERRRFRNAFPPPIASSHVEWFTGQSTDLGRIEWHISKWTNTNEICRR